MLQTYLPERYAANTAQVVDSEGSFSEQMDVVIFDSFSFDSLVFTFDGLTCSKRHKPDHTAHRCSYTSIAVTTGTCSAVAIGV